MRLCSRLPRPCPGPAHSLQAPPSAIRLPLPPWPDQGSSPQTSPCLVCILLGTSLYTEAGLILSDISKATFLFHKKPPSRSLFQGFLPQLGKPRLVWPYFWSLSPGTPLTLLHTPAIKLLSPQGLCTCGPPWPRRAFHRYPCSSPSFFRSLFKGCLVTEASLGTLCKAGILRSLSCDIVSAKLEGWQKLILANLHARYYSNTHIIPFLPHNMRKVLLLRPFYR